MNSPAADGYFVFSLPRPGHAPVLLEDRRVVGGLAACFGWVSLDLVGFGLGNEKARGTGVSRTSFPLSRLLAARSLALTRRSLEIR